IRATWVRICTRSFASRFDSGSSIKNAFGSRTMARPMATRWRWPPDRFAGLRSRCCSSSRIDAASLTLRSISFLLTLASLSANPVALPGVEHRGQAGPARLARELDLAVDHDHVGALVDLVLLQRLARRQLDQDRSRLAAGGVQDLGLMGLDVERAQVPVLHGR